MKTCRNCQAVSPDEALRCDCGYEFASGKIEQSYLASSQQYPFKPSFNIKLTAWIWMSMGWFVLFSPLVFWALEGFPIRRPAPDNAEAWMIFSLGVRLPIFLGCCVRYAVLKGYHWAMGFLGLTGPLGLIILMALDYKKR